MNKRKLSQLQRLINNTVAAKANYDRHQTVLQNFCREHYGCVFDDIVEGFPDAEEFDRDVEASRCRR